MDTSDDQHSEEQSAEPTLGEVAKPLEEHVPVVAKGDDGLPDPLATIAEILPGGRGTRGKPPLGFVQTRLDTFLTPALRERPPTLVILSGNAGDGKTTFLAELLKTSYMPGVKNEYDIDIAPNRPYRIVLDGSEDAENRTNDALLEGALSPFSGPDPVMNATKGTLIAINKGRLLRFLHARSTTYSYLWSLARATFLGEQLEVRDGPYILLDLNNRSFVGPDFDSSLLVDVMRQLSGWRGWDKCAMCPVHDACPALANVRSMASVASTDQHPNTAYQLWRVFAAADLDDRVHITARHALSQLARLISNGRRCPDIRLEGMSGKPFQADGYIFNSTFDSFGGHALGDTSILDEVLSTYDPSDHDSPINGRYIHTAIAIPDLYSVMPFDYEEFFEVEVEELAELPIESETPRGTLDYRQRVISLSHTIQRKLFLADTGAPAPDFALETIDRFIELTQSHEAPEAVETLISCLNASLGVDAGGISELLSPRDYSRGLQGRGFAMLIPPNSFVVVPGTGQGVPFESNEFLEGWPRSLLLRAIERQRDGNVPIATLAVPLLMFELLNKAARGFRPASQTERAYMVRLRGFYRQLSEHRWQRAPDYALFDAGRIIGRARIDGERFAVMGA